MHKTALLLSLALPVACGGCTGAQDPMVPSALPQTAAATTDGVVSASDKGGRAGPIGAVYVTSQGLYFDTFVAVDPLPMEGHFQRLSNGQTDFGPGDPGYLGGRWWEDLNGNGMQDEGDHFFLCPLLPPGRPTP